MNFVNHCYVDTEVEMKEIYTSNHIWKLFDNFLVDMSRVRLSQILKVAHVRLVLFLTRRRARDSLITHCGWRDKG